MDKRLKQLQDQMAAINAELKGMLAAAVDDTGAPRAMTDAEKAAYDARDKQAELIAAQIKEEQKIRDRMVAAKLALPAVTMPDAPTPEQLREINGESKVPAEPKQPKWKSFGEQLQAIMHASAPGRVYADPRLQFEAAVSGSSAGSPDSGGFLVDRQFAPGLLEKVYSDGQILSRIEPVEIGPDADGLKVNAIDETSRANGSRFGGVQCYWLGEGSQITGTRPKLRQISLELKDLNGLWYVTDRLLKDATALEQLAMKLFSQEIGYTIEEAVINGNGVGKPQGIADTGATCVVEVAKEANQAATTVVFANIRKMWARMWAPARLNAVWFMNQDVETALAEMSIPVGTGGVPVFMPAGGLSSQPYSTLYGRPIVPIEQAQTLGTRGDIILADMREYLLIRKGGVEMASSIHLRFDYNETAFRWTARANGMPKWNSALTPAKGSNTLSPFVVLATRA